MAERKEKRPPAFLRYLAENVRCASCGEAYHLEDLHVLGHQDEVWFVAVSCRKCETRGVIFAMVHEGELPAKWDWAEELTEEERERFAALPRIGVGEVLAIRRHLNDFQGDMYELVGGEDTSA